MLILFWKMETRELSKELKSLLKDYKTLLYDESKGKIRCTLSNHEMPCRSEEVEKFLNGKKYQNLLARKETEFEKYQPHILPSTRKYHEHQMFCVLTLRHINKTATHIEKHMTGARYKRAFARWQECQKTGTEFKPVRGPRKREDRMEGKGGKSKGSNSIDSEDDPGEISDTDSLSDLYPAKVLADDSEGSASDFDVDDLDVESGPSIEPQPANNSNKNTRKHKLEKENDKTKKSKKKKKQKIK